MSLIHRILQRNFYENAIFDGAKILDVGCGNGDLVNFMRQGGYDAFGIDIQFKHGEHKSILQSKGIIKKIDVGDKSRATLSKNDVYVWPKFECLFDVIVSKAVIEHVRNLDEFVISSKAVLKKGGICIHYFPSKYSVIEPHIGVPFGGVLTYKMWITLMCFLGICFSARRGKGTEAYSYMTNFTTYRKQSEIDMVFSKAGFQRIKSIGPLQCHPQKIFRLFGCVSFLNYLFSIFRSSVVVYKLA